MEELPATPTEAAARLGLHERAVRILARRSRDYPVLQGAFLLMAVGVIAANLLADLIYPLLDPRVRTEDAA